MSDHWSASHALYFAAMNQVVPTGDASCMLCGFLHSDGVDPSSVIRDTFTNHGMCRVPSSNSICAACNHYFNHRWDVGGAREMEYRKRSLKITLSGVVEWDRNQMESDVAEALRSGHDGGVWVCAISKKKHCLPLAPINSPGKSLIVQVEEEQAKLTRCIYFRVSSAFRELLKLGCLKSHILSGRYSHRSVKGSPATVLELDRRIAPHRPSAMLKFISYAIVEDSVDGN